MIHLLSFGAVQSEQMAQSREKNKTVLFLSGGGGEGSYRGLGVEGGRAMLKRVGTVAFWSGRRGTVPHAADWLDSTRSRLGRKEIIV